MRTQTSFAATLTTTLCLASTMAVLGLLHADAPSRACESGADGEREGVDLPRASLVGRLLVASPALDDPYFAGTVIYMLADDAHGAIGVVINRARDHVEHQDVALWDGGPVGRERVFVLHDDLTAARAVRIGDVAVESDPAILDELFSGRGPPSRGGAARVFVGYAGWGPGQLDGEIAAGAWRTASAPAGLVLSSDPASITTSAYATLALIE